MLLLLRQVTIIGLFRDLQGVASATNSRKNYGLLFDWLYPAHFPVIVACLKAWADVPAVTTPLLKFMAEFVFNKGQRLTFDSSSANGILLFRCGPKKLPHSVSCRNFCCHAKSCCW